MNSDTETDTDSTSQQNISILVRDNVNALSRIIGVCSGRNCIVNAVHYTVAEEPGYAQMTLTTRLSPPALEQLLKQLRNIVDVQHAHITSPDTPRTRTGKATE